MPVDVPAPHGPIGLTCGSQGEADASHAGLPAGCALLVQGWLCQGQAPSARHTLSGRLPTAHPNLHTTAGEVALYLFCSVFRRSVSCTDTPSVHAAGRTLKGSFKKRHLCPPPVPTSSTIPLFSPAAGSYQANHRFLQGKCLPCCRCLGSHKSACLR